MFNGKKYDGKEVKGHVNNKRNFNHKKSLIVVLDLLENCERKLDSFVVLGTGHASKIKSTSKSFEFIINKGELHRIMNVINAKHIVM